MSLVNKILAIPLIPIGTDKITWTKNRFGASSIKSGHNTLHPTNNHNNQFQASSSYQPHKKLQNLIWQLHTYPNIRFFTWSMCTNALLTKENLYKRKMTLDPLYPICHSELETPKHLFLLCQWTKKVWSNPDLRIDPSPQK